METSGIRDARIVKCLLRKTAGSKESQAIGDGAA
jgi:hypothetical protein